MLPRAPADRDAPDGAQASADADAEWPPHAGAPLLDTLARAWRLSVFAPARFFPALGRDRTLLPALLYYLVVGVAAAGITLFWKMVLPRAVSLPGPLEEIVALGASLSPLTDFLLSPLVLLAALALAAAAVHVLLVLVGGAHRGFRTTVRVLCFAYGPQLFVVVPVLGAMIGGVWTLVLAIAGLRHAHGTGGGKAALAVLLPLALWLLLLAVAGVVLLLGRIEP